MINEFYYSDISKYRTKLMGVGTLSVLILHLLYWCNLYNVDSYIVKFLKVFPRLVYTDGFIILSGFGLFYSFTKEKNVKSFYYKRFLRLYIPFILMSFPFYIFLTDNIKNFLLSTSGLYFYINGNNGMWYISITLLFYLLFPLLYITINKWYLELLTMIVLILIPFIIYQFFPNYFMLTEIGITLFPFFYFGIILGKLSYNQKKIQFYHLLILLFVIVLLFLFKNTNLCIEKYYHSSVRLASILFLCVLFKITKEIKIIENTFNFLGKYSLEIYMLHMLSYQLLSRVEFFGVNSFFSA